MNRIVCVGVLLMYVLLVSACGSGSSNGGGGTGATLTGTVNNFTATLAVEKKSLFAQIKDFFLSKASAQTAGITVSVGSLSTTTDSSGHFTLSDIPEGSSTITFTQGGNSATYTLAGVAAGETFTLNDIDIVGSAVSTAHTGTWTGIMTMNIFTDTPVDVAFTLTIAAGGNSISGNMFIDEGGLGEVGTFSGTETGTILDARWANTVPDSEGCILSGPLTGTFDGNTLTGNEPIDDAGSCPLQPGDDDPDSHPFTLTKQ